MAQDPSQNAFLKGLPLTTIARLRPELRPVDLVLGEMIHRAERPVDHVYFPISGLLSQVNRAASGQGVETAMIGVDGVGGILEALGSGRTVWESMVQVDGVALRASSQFIRRLAAEDRAFMDACWRLAETQAFETQQSVMCQAMHAGEQRLARWLLEAHERSGRRNPLPFTQDILSTMLGVQRTTVTAFYGQLKGRGLVRGGRGWVELTDISRLDGCACECRRIIGVRMESSRQADLLGGSALRQTS